MADPRPGPVAPRPRAGAPARTAVTGSGPPPAAAPAKATPRSPVPEPGPGAPPQPSLGELVANASQQMSVLVRSEIELAKLELKVEAKKAAVGAAGLGAAAFLGLFALLMLSFAAAYGINSAGLAKGWSFLIVGGTYLLLAGIGALVGARSAKRIGPPKRTIRTTKDTIGALKDAGRGAGKPAPTEAGV